jgi:hypothetical protein
MVFRKDFWWNICITCICWEYMDMEKKMDMKNTY